MSATKREKFYVKHSHSLLEICHQSPAYFDFKTVWLYRILNVTTYIYSSTNRLDCSCLVYNRWRVIGCTNCHFAGAKWGKRTAPHTLHRMKRPPRGCCCGESSTVCPETFRCKTTFCSFACIFGMASCTCGLVR